MRTPDLEYGIHPDIDANTLVFYPVDEGSGTTAADVVNGRNVSRGGGVTWVSALIGKGVNIQAMTAGMTDGVTAAGTDAAALQGAWSCEAWVRPMAASQGSFIEFSDPSGVAAANRVQMSVGVAADLKVFWRWENAAGNVGYFGGGGTPSTGQLRAGVWQHVAVTKESDGAGTFTVKIYINGFLDNTQTTQAPRTEALLDSGNWAPARWVCSRAHLLGARDEHRPHSGADQDQLAARDAMGGPRRDRPWRHGREGHSSAHLERPRKSTYGTCSVTTISSQRRSTHRWMSNATQRTSA